MKPTVQCEFCDGFTSEPMEGYAERCFCSDECAQEFYERKRIGREESRCEYELYGDDLDSWFR